MRSFVPFMQMQSFTEDPFVISKGEGIRIYDENGKSYIDGLSGVFVASVGHGNKKVINAMYEQMQQLTFHPSIHGTNPTALNYSQALLDFAPDNLGGVMLLNGGSEATETALKMAKQYHRQTGNPTKYKVLATYGSFHGCTAGATAISGGWERRTVYEPLTVGVIHLYPAHCYRCPFDKEYPHCGITCANLVEYTIKNEDPSTLGALVLNPIMISSAGFVVPPKEYHQKIRDICDKYNVLLIYDEIITGFGRLGEKFAADYYGVYPDILCCGKGMSGGYVPLAATMFSEKIRQSFLAQSGQRREFHHGHTFTGTPLASAAGHAVLKEILENNLIENARKIGSQIAQRLEAMKERFWFVGDIRGAGLLQGMEFIRDRSTKEPFGSQIPIVKMIEASVKRQGMIMRCGPEYIALAPPLITSSDEADEICNILEKALEEVESRL